jgi:hypothetical protein
MQVPGWQDAGRGSSDFVVAAEDAARLVEQAVPQVDGAVGVQWYSEPGTDVDRAALSLCLLRRTQAGVKGGPEYGDEAVRRVLAEARPGALVWIASRAISYMDETGFPEAVEPWFREDVPGRS